MNKFKNMTTKHREGDRLHIDLLDYLNDYQTEIKISQSKMRKFLQDFDISEEGFTTITGSESDWIKFMCMIIEKYSS